MQKLPPFILSAILLSSPVFTQETIPQSAGMTPVVSTPVAAEPPLAVQPVAQGDVQFDEKRDPDADDMEALRRWIRDKRLVTVKEIGGDLSISGEVRAEFQDTNEVKNGIRQRGDGGAVNKAQYAWDLEVNVMIDYRTDRTWAAIKLEFDNDMGQRSGTVNKIRLEKGYLGGRIIPGDTFTFDAEIGRRYLYNVFDSQLEFSSLYDGVLFRFNKSWEEIGNYYFNVGALLVNDKTNHYAYVCETGGLRIANTGLNMKYSLIDWYKPSANRINDLRYKYLISQYLISYQFYPEWIGKRLIKFYGAGLCNHLASGVEQTHGRRQNYGWYTGFSIGVVKKQYDWAINANYQWCQAQAVPDFDSSGIGRGNAASVGFYTINADGDPASGETTAATAVGSCNFKGFEVEALYAFTDNLTLLQNFKYSNTLNKNIGPNLRYKQYEMEVIYAF
ncbi:MAG: hypothetical protein COT85_06245 [Chlamydiae bacterium CG10_big_fil_rev_8_21_14_0_10_42_34]|nr:MAG: hypothetical protein COT85_06245 [Chlamydiae bacterium CG10_big_fil_rev_8_21_14_0_10_42_34]